MSKTSKKVIKFPTVGNSTSKIQWKAQQNQSTFKPKYESFKSQNIQHNSKIQRNNSKLNYKHKSIEKREEKEKEAQPKTRLNLPIANLA